MSLMHRSAKCALLSPIVFAILAAMASAELKTEFKTYNEALREGSRLAREMKHAEAQGALEAALQLAKDDKQRVQAYQLLLGPYRQLPEIDKMLEAQDFLLKHEGPAEECGQRCCFVFASAGQARRRHRAL